MDNTLDEFQRKLKEGIVEFTYLTVRGIIRKAYGTTNPIHKFERVKTPHDAKKIVFYDMSREHWFSMRKTNLIKVGKFHPWGEK